ncbi:pathogenesis-like protein [Medicago truncatula]|uniref:Pathogenesis-like protein n=1 Tax=Medicago truncatula TaxID=3880 RepID=G7LCT0_MEDTR|nr:pathogenesis-like protein [Medicago truncatula]
MPPALKLLSIAWREGLTAEETLRLGSYNALMKNSLPEEYKYYKAEEETFESSHELRLLTSFKGHAPTGNMVEFYGFRTLKISLFNKFTIVTFPNSLNN